MKIGKVGKYSFKASKLGSVPLNKKPTNEIVDGKPAWTNCRGRAMSEPDSASVGGATETREMERRGRTTQQTNCPEYRSQARFGKYMVLWSLVGTIQIEKRALFLLLKRWLLWFWLLTHQRDVVAMVLCQKGYGAWHYLMSLLSGRFVFNIFWLCQELEICLSS